MPSKLYDHCVNVYEAMDGKAFLYTDRRLRVYHGFITYLFEELGIGLSTYTPVMRRLQDMGCVKQIWVGSRSRPSRWELLKEPTIDLFDSSTPKRRSRLADLEERVAALEQKLAS